MCSKTCDSVCAYSAQVSSVCWKGSTAVQSKEVSKNEDEKLRSIDKDLLITDLAHWLVWAQTTNSLAVPFSSLQEWLQAAVIAESFCR